MRRRVFSVFLCFGMCVVFGRDKYVFFVMNLAHSCIIETGRLRDFVLMYLFSLTINCYVTCVAND